jgi:hypothetical protein
LGFEIWNFGIWNLNFPLPLMCYNADVFFSP